MFNVKEDISETCYSCVDFILILFIPHVIVISAYLITLGPKYQLNSIPSNDIAFKLLTYQLNSISPNDIVFKLLTDQLNSISPKHCFQIAYRST